MRYLGLDLGTKTIGLAISDKTGLIATSYKVLHHDNKPEDCLEELKTIINDLEVEGLVLGLPKNMNNTLGPASERSLQFKELLEKNFALPVYLVDERLSTVEAEKILLMGDKSRKKRKKVIDNVASALILDTFLKERRNTNE